MRAVTDPETKIPKAKRIRPWLELTLIPILLILVMMYLLSAQNAETSANLSGGIVVRILRILHPDYPALPESEQLSLLETWSFLVRKAAHFTEFFILGVFTCLHGMFGSGKRIPAFAVLFCALAAVSDEVHQMFVDGRGPGVGDVLLDTAAASAAVCLIWLLARRRHRKNAANANADPAAKKNS